LKYEADRQAAELQRNLEAGIWHIDAGFTTRFRDYVVLPVLSWRQDSGLAGSKSARSESCRHVVVSKATAGWDERTGRTEIQRRKEEASDYRYFPEPDLVPVTVDEVTLTRVCAELGELPASQKTRLQAQYALMPYDAGVLSRQGRAFVAYYEAVVQHCGDAKEA